MIEFFKKLLWDETAFIRHSRAMLMLVAGMVGTSGGEWIPQWAAAPLMALSVWLGAGDRNPEQEEKP